MTISAAATADRFTGQYADRAAFAAAVLGRLIIELKSAGHRGARIAAADWTAGDQPQLAVTLEAGGATWPDADALRAVLTGKGM